MIVAIGVRMLTDAIFQVWGDPYSTNWCIAVNFTKYIAWSAVFMHTAIIVLSQKMPNIIDNNKVFLNWVFHVSGIVYIAYSFIELTYINAPFEVYKLAMFQAQYQISHTLAILLSFAAYYCINRAKRINEVYRYV
jgi:hypothetical protein